MGVDQPRQHGRIAIVEQFTIGRRLVRHRLNPDNAPLIEKRSGTTGPEILAVEGMVCTDREHIAWLPNPPAPVNALPSSVRSLNFAGEKNSDQPAGPSHARP
jgi:hypothetical protein